MNRFLVNSLALLTIDTDLFGCSPEKQEAHPSDPDEIHNEYLNPEYNVIVRTLKERLGQELITHGIPSC